MKKTLQILAVLMMLAAGATWLVTGAHVGWTKTNRPNGTIDEVTGIVDQTPVKCFVAGVDFLGGATAVAVALAGASFFFRKPKPNYNQNNQQQLT